jgi:hypothetical protein
MNTPYFPLGPPTNRKEPEPALHPAVGRPDWWIDGKGLDRYIVPPAKPVPHPDQSGGFQ